MACISGGLSPEGHRYLEHLDQRRRNVDKQRRRLLALKCSHKARTCDMSAHAAVDGDPEYARWLVGHASKLRAIAARLRGTHQPGGS